MLQIRSHIHANFSKCMNEDGSRFAWQKKHHTKMSFEEEFLALLKKHKIEYDPKYVFG